MLTGDLVRPRIGRRGDRIWPKLLKAYDEQWLQTATDLLAIFHKQIGQTRGTLHDACSDYEGTRIDYATIRGIASVISSKSVWAMVNPESDGEISQSPAASLNLVPEPSIEETMYTQSEQTGLRLVAEERPAYGGLRLVNNEQDRQILDSTESTPIKLYLVPPPPSPAELRAAVWGAAAQMWPVVRQADLVFRHDRMHVLAQVGAQYNMSDEAVSAALFADLPEEQVLEAVPNWEPSEVILRYNLELSRGLLYWASEMRVVVRGNYKDLFRYLKLFKLMHTIRLLPDGGYHITVDGPMSPFVHSSTRYGRQMARFLPALLLCPGWEMEADVQLRGPGNSVEGLYKLDSNTPDLHSWFPTSDSFDSELERNFAAEFEEKYTRTKKSWTLTREDEIVPLGDTVMIPDFALTHKDNRRVLVELVGFWHPDYLRRKIAKLRAAKRNDMIVLVYAGLSCTPEDFKDVASEVIFFTDKPVLKDVIEAADKRAIPVPQSSKVVPEESARKPKRTRKKKVDAE